MNTVPRTKARTTLFDKFFAYSLHIHFEILLWTILTGESVLAEILFLVVECFPKLIQRNLDRILRNRKLLNFSSALRGIDWARNFGEGGAGVTRSVHGGG